MPDHKWTGASRILLVGTRAGLFGVVLDAGQRYAAPRALAPAGRRQAADARALGSAITVVSRTHLVGNCESSAAYPNQCAHLHPGNTVPSRLVLRNKVWGTNRYRGGERKHLL